MSHQDTTGRVYSELLQQLQKAQTDVAALHERVKQAESAEAACERYACEMEHALEAIQALCRITGAHSESWGEDSLRDMIRTIGRLARVKDTRGSRQLPF